jgi:hypothetical protein
VFVESFELLEGLRRTVINLRIVHVWAELQAEQSRRRYRLRHRVCRSVCPYPFDIALNSTQEKCSFFVYFIDNLWFFTDENQLVVSRHDLTLCTDVTRHQ